MTDVFGGHRELLFSIVYNMLGSVSDIEDVLQDTWLAWSSRDPDPLERAVFVLHEVFAFQHTEIAGMLGSSPAAVRQLAHRAREHVQARRPRYRVDAHVQREVTERFVAAAFGGDLDALMELLAPEVTLWADGGGKSVVGGPRPVRGRDKVARLLVARTAQPMEGLDIQYRETNGDPSAVVFVENAPFAVMVVDLTSDGSQVRDIYTVANPDKLSRVRAPGADPS
ncbi:sigma factor-like helix-turn-helix DNA-binding protein [Nonomuraea sp. NPDC048881]|uniref:sigma factor-like helix-turn-helix DNA-binding protein n=1 Tax=Nonomuraea sp. NPDC048881 TaxID=3155030 RepID=UPI0033E76384